MKKTEYTKPLTRAMKIDAQPMLSGSGEYIYKDDPGKDPDPDKETDDDGDYWLAE